MIWGLDKIQLKNLISFKLFSVFNDFFGNKQNTNDKVRSISEKWTNNQYNAMEQIVDKSELYVMLRPCQLTITRLNML